MAIVGEQGELVGAEAGALAAEEGLEEAGCKDEDGEDLQAGGGQAQAEAGAARAAIAHDEQHEEHGRGGGGHRQPVHRPPDKLGRFDHLPLPRRS